MGKAFVVVAACTGCIGTVSQPPTAGYGDPYRGTGEQISVKDSRTDWDITEGGHKITSEQALEATGDAEYEARRQIARDYNVRIYREGQAHRSRGNVMIGIGAGLTAIGLVLVGVVAKSLQQETITPPMGTMPEMRSYTASTGTTLSVDIGIVAVALGVVGMSYGYLGGKRPPPYHYWETPGPLNRPAYVRQQTEPYNEKLGKTPPTNMPNAPRTRMPPMRRPR